MQTFHARNTLTVPTADLEAMTAWARAITARPPDFTVGPPSNPQLKRWYAIPLNPVGNVYVHRFYRSDDDRACHDHPWDNTSWLLEGRYTEHLGDGSVRVLTAGEWVSRRAEEPHWVELTDGPVLTLFFTGAIRRSWGFHCPGGRWVHWREFVSVRPGGNERGRGCEEGA